ncbi:MAG TPA: hypothetical protein VG916_04305 [Gemmatimonadaceae bacterium]|nr:hypothetical protein [Gemmatimonadaceae bacterium]
MNRAVAALFRLHLLRLRRTAVTLVVTSCALAALYAVQHPVTVDSMLPWFLGGAGVLPMAPALLMAREKADGSLRYFASLPVTPGDHASARALTVFLLTLPAGAIVMLAMRQPPLSLPAGLAGMAGAGACVAMAGLGLVLLAVQIALPPGEGFRYLLYTFVAFLGVMQVAGFVGKLGVADIAMRVLRTPTGLGALSAALWIAMGVAIWAALKVIGTKTVAYRGDPVIMP